MQDMWGAMTNSELALVGDIGATSSLALILPDETVTRARVVASADFGDIGDAIIDYLASEEAPNRPARGVLAIAAAMVIPTYVIMRPVPALLGAARLLRQL